MPWYVRFGNLNQSDPNSYSLVGGSPPTCLGFTKICAVRAADNGSNHPVITQALMGEMVQALENGANTSNILLRD